MRMILIWAIVGIVGWLLLLALFFTLFSPPQRRAAPGVTTGAPVSLVVPA